MKIALTEQQVKNLATNVLASSNGSNPFEGIDTEIQKVAPNLSKLGKLLSGVYKGKPMDFSSPMDPSDGADISPEILKSLGTDMLHPLGKKMDISSTYGQRNTSVGSKNHKGVDIAAPSGSPVYAPLDGVVLASRDTSPNGCGGFVKLDHDKIITKFCHLRKLVASEGQRVKKGQLIGYSGGGKNDPMRGVATGAHLHYEILDKSSGIAMNPMTVQKNLA